MVVKIWNKELLNTTRTHSRLHLAVQCIFHHWRQHVPHRCTLYPQFCPWVWLLLWALMLVKIWNMELLNTTRTHSRLHLAVQCIFHHWRQHVPYRFTLYPQLCPWVWLLSWAQMLVKIWNKELLNTTRTHSRLHLAVQCIFHHWRQHLPYRRTLYPQLCPWVWLLSWAEMLVKIWNKELLNNTWTHSWLHLAVQCTFHHWTQHVPSSWSSPTAWYRLGSYAACTVIGIVVMRKFSRSVRFLSSCAWSAIFISSVCCFFRVLVAVTSDRYKVSGNVQWKYILSQINNLPYFLIDNARVIYTKKV